MKKVMILGAGTYQVPLILTAKRMGLYTIVVSIPGAYKGFALADKTYKINTRDQEAVLKAARREQIDAICTSGTDVAVSTIGYVCREMGLCGIPYEAAQIVTDKARMKEAFLKGGVCTSDGQKAFRVSEALEAAGRIGYPVVVKRVDSSGSRGISVVHAPEEMEAAFSHALEKSMRNYVLVEGFLTGHEIGVDGFVQGGKLVFLAPHEKFVYQSPQITIPIGHAFPYVCSQKVREEISRQMQSAVAATGVDHCSVNADVFVDNDRVSIIEIGGRTGATCIPELISMHYGFDFYEKMLRSALGEEITFETGNPQDCMAKLLLSPVSGTITAIDHDRLNVLRQMGLRIELDYPVGHRVTAMVDGTDRIGHVIAHVSHPLVLDRLIARVRSCISIDGRSLEEIWND